MALTPGSKLGPYEVLSLLGAGGMGEVYRARDTRLGRTVAIKVLPAERMADESRRRRFVQEARAASALSHPNIVTIFEIESAGEIDFIVMEYVEGASLDTLIPRQGMRLREVLRIATPIADALAKAHAAGIVHRDLKPANVAIGADGVVKVLDFGLAKLVTLEPGSPEHETVSEDGDAGPLSRPGTLTGTAGYMSPEQAAGGTVDARSDVFSFGAVLYEMVTGRRAFSGKSTAETRAAVLRDQPKAPSEVVAGVPRELEKIILRCLQKDLGRRFQHMQDVKIELQEIREETESASAGAAVGFRRSRSWLVAAAMGVALLVAAVTWRAVRPAPVPPPPPELVVLTTMRGWVGPPSFSPDGTQIAFGWSGEKVDSADQNSDIYVMIIGQPELRRLTTGMTDAGLPSWSPDGRQIAFKRDGEIRVVSPLGGLDRKLSDLQVEDGPLSWSPDGRWLAADHDGSIYLVPAQGGEPRRITLPTKGSYDALPAFSPDGRRLAYASCANVSCQIQLLALDREGVPSRPLAPLPKAESSKGASFTRGWGNGLAWTRDGESLIYESDWRLWRAGASGEERPQRIEVAGLKALRPVTTASRDRLAFVRPLFDEDIYRFEVGHQPKVTLSSSFQDFLPSFSQDGRRIAFTSSRSGDRDEIWIASADGSNPTQLTHGPGAIQGSPRFSPDGRRVAFDSFGEDGHWDIYLTDTDGGVAHRLTEDPGNEQQPTWSRDGRFVYFTSDRAGDADVWRIPAAGGAEERLTHRGGELAFESTDARTLYFKRRSGDSPLLALPLAGGPERQILDCVPGFGFTVGPGGLYYFDCKGWPSRSLHVLDPTTGRDQLLGTLERAAQAESAITVSPDGKTFLYSKQVGEGNDLAMIENFR